MAGKRRGRPKVAKIAHPYWEAEVFFLRPGQKKMLDKALSATGPRKKYVSKAIQRSQALQTIAEFYLYPMAVKNLPNLTK